MLVVILYVQRGVAHTIKTKLIAYGFPIYLVLKDCVLWCIAIYTPRYLNSVTLVKYASSNEREIVDSASSGLFVSLDVFIKYHVDNLRILILMSNSWSYLSITLNIFFWQQDDIYFYLTNRNSLFKTFNFRNKILNVDRKKSGTWRITLFNSHIYIEIARFSSQFLHVLLSCCTSS